MVPLNVEEISLPDGSLPPVELMDVCPEGAFYLNNWKEHMLRPEVDMDQVMVSRFYKLQEHGQMNLNN